MSKIEFGEGYEPDPKLFICNQTANTSCYGYAEFRKGKKTKISLPLGSHLSSGYTLYLKAMSYLYNEKE